MSQTRQLAAIMFTDIVGYTTLMGDDEQNAFALLSKNRELQKPIIEEFKGQWIKELGDGVMASFNNVSDAVNADIKIQVKCMAAKDFKLRVGIHLGEVVFENGDVPFANMSNDAEQEFFSDGITEEIINVLAQVPGLKVIGWTSSFAFKGKNIDLKLIGEKLKVNYLLEGSVRRSGSKLRITA